MTIFECRSGPDGVWLDITELRSTFINDFTINFSLAVSIKVMDFALLIQPLVIVLYLRLTLLIVPRRD